MFGLLSRSGDRRRKVNLFIIGAQKAGTTALHAYLAGHPDIFMSERKELHFFDDDSRDWSNPDFFDLEKHFLCKKVAIYGEATPIYLYWPNCLERIKAYNPDARLIVLVRHPAYRAFSHWKMETVRGDETMTFSDAIGEKGRQRVARAPAGFHRVYSYLERGFYALQIMRLLALFPYGQVHFATSDDLWLHPHQTLALIEKFLGVRHLLQPAQTRYTLASTDISVDLGRPMLRHLNALYASDIREAAMMSGLNLSGWLSSQYVEPQKV